MLGPEDEITSGEDLIHLNEVRARIEHLKPYHVEDTRIPESAVADPTVAAFGTEEAASAYLTGQDEETRPHLEVVTWDDEAEELTALRELLTAMEGTGSARVSAINTSYLGTAVRDDIEGIAGSDAIAVLGNYVDWDTLTGDRGSVLTQVTYRGTVFYLEP